MAKNTKNNQSYEIELFVMIGGIMAIFLITLNKIFENNITNSLKMIGVFIFLILLVLLSMKIWKNEKKFSEKHAPEYLKQTSKYIR